MNPPLAVRDVQSVRELLAQLPRNNLDSLLSKVLQTAIQITSADMGNIQLVDPLSSTLRIAAHRGFHEPFLEFFSEVNHRQAACGTSLKLMQRVVVEDVAKSPIFIGTESLQVLSEAGVQAVQSTPLVIPSGIIIGVLSTHYRSSRRPTDIELALLDELVSGSVEMIEAAQQLA